MLRRIVVGLSIFFFAFGCVLCMAVTPADPTAWNLKTPAPDAGRIRPFLDSLSSLRADLDKSDKIPADAAARLAKVMSSAGAFEQQSASLTSALKQNNETAAFDELIAARLKKGGHSATIAEIQKFGGASAMLSNTKKAIDDDVTELSSRINQKIPEKAANLIFGSVLQLLETQDAEAGLYGGGVKGTCSYLLVVYYMSIGVEPTFCLLH